MLLKKLRVQSQGDTIIEVLLSVTILGLVLALSFTSAGRSLSAGTDAANRNQALAYAQQQVELLRSAANADKLDSLPLDGTYFCIDPASGNVTKLSGGNFCYPSNQDQFGVAIRYNASNQTFNVGGQWQTANGTDQVSLYYQTPVNPITTVPNVGITISASPKFISYSQDSTITWSTTTASSCKASGGWNGTQALAGSRLFKNIQNTTTYSLTCIGNDGVSKMTRSTQVYVSPLPAPTINLTASPNPVIKGNRATLNWSSSGATDCRADGGPWGGDKGTSGSEQTVPLNSDTTFTIQCNGVPGAPSSQQSYTVNTIVVTPKAQTLSAESYGNANVYFRSYINPEGYASTAWYEWANNPSMTGCVLSTAAFGEPAVSYQIYDRRYGSYWGNGTPVNYYNCDSNYYWYRVCVYNNYNPSGVVCGNPVLFGLLAPSVSTGGNQHDSPPGVSNSSGWELYGSVNPNGNNVDSCYFQWDNDSNLDQGERNTNCTSYPGGGTSSVNVTTHIDLDWYYRGEEDNRYFYYRLCAHTSVGTRCGSTQAFHTR